MSVNKTSPMLSSLSKSASKKLTGEEQRAWFLIETSKESFFYIDKKISDPAKFKDPVKCQKILEKMSIDGINSIKAQSILIAGVVARGGEGFHITVTIKKNGGSKATLKNALKDGTVKKIIPNTEIVKEIEILPASQEAIHENVIDTAVEAEIQENRISPELKKAIQIFLWWKQEGKSMYERLLVRSTPADEEFVQKAKRRLTKFEKEKMYKLFEPRFFGFREGILQKFKFEDFDMTKEEIRQYLADLKSILSTIQSTTTEITDEEIENLIGDFDIIAEMSRLEVLAKQLMLSEHDGIDFIDQAQSYITTVENLLSWFSPIEIKRFKDFFGDGSWEKFLAFALLAGTKLKSASDHWGGPKKLIARCKKYDELHPIHVLALGESGTWKWDLTKPLVLEARDEIRSQPKVTEHTVVLFAHENITPILAHVPFTPILRDSVSVAVTITLTAKSPEALQYGLDNPYIAQIVYDSGDFQLLISNICRKFSVICNAHHYDPFDPEDIQGAKLASIKTDLEKVIDFEQNQAAERATEAASLEFGREANIQSARRWQKANLALKAVKTGVGIFATVAVGVATAGIGCGAVILSAHGVAKNILSIGYDIRAMQAKFAQNIESMQSDLEVIQARVSAVGNAAAHIGSRIGETILGDIIQPWNRIAKYAENANLSLSEIKVRAAHMSSEINSLLEISSSFSKKLAMLQQEITAQSQNEDIDQNVIRILDAETKSLQSSLQQNASSVQNAVEGSATMGQYIALCEARFQKITTEMESFDPSTPVEVFLRIYDVLEFAGGILAVAGLQDPKVIGGLNPINSDHGWITAANFSGYVSSLDDARSIIVQIHKTITS